MEPIIRRKLSQYMTIEFLRDFDPTDFIKHDIVDKKTGAITVRYSPEGLNVYRTYVEPNIEEFVALLDANEVIDPLIWLTNIHYSIGVEYKKYLYVKALHSKLTKNKRNYQKVMELWNLMGYDNE